MIHGCAPAAALDSLSLASSASPPFIAVRTTGDDCARQKTLDTFFNVNVNFHLHFCTRRNSMATVAVSHPSTSSKPQHPLRERNFRRLWIGSTVSLFGDQFYLV